MVVIEDPVSVVAEIVSVRHCVDMTDRVRVRDRMSVNHPVCVVWGSARFDNSIAVAKADISMASRSYCYTTPHVWQCEC